MQRIPSSSSGESFETNLTSKHKTQRQGPRILLTQSLRETTPTDRERLSLTEAEAEADNTRLRYTRNVYLYCKKPTRHETQTHTRTRWTLPSDVMC